MLNIRSLRELKKENVIGKKFLVRVDFNVPIDENGIVKDFNRIDAAKETIRYIIDNGGKAILCSHLGRPKGKRVKELTLRPIADALSARISKQVDFVDDCIGEKVIKNVNKMKDGQILLLENLRFYNEEEGYAKKSQLGEEAQLNIDFAKELANNYDFFVNDAFAAMHRAHASITGVVEQGNLPAYAGFLVEKELEILLPLVNPGDNSIAIIGGGKLKEKIGSIESVASKYSNVILGGVVSNVFLSINHDVGYSLTKEKKDDKDYRDNAKNILMQFDNIILPKKVIIAKSDFSEKKTIDIIKGVPYGYSIFDDLIDSETLNLVANANVVVWCGPLGLFEKGFKDGNYDLGKAIESNKDGITVIGGGETAEAAGRIKVTHISTGGGATLELLTKGTLPGLDVLQKK